MKNNNGHKVEPRGTPTVTFRPWDVWPLRLNLCFLSLKKLDKRSKKDTRDDILRQFKKGTLCHTLSKASKMSKKCFWNGKLRAIDNSWLMQESPGLNPDWFGEIRLFSGKKLISSLKISLSRIFPNIGVMKADGSFQDLSPFCWIGTKFSFFWSDGNKPKLKLYWKLVLMVRK